MKRAEKVKCLFCESPEIKERTIIKNNLAWAFLTNIPIVPGHVLIAPIRCIQKLEEITFKELKAILDLRIKLKKAYQKIFKSEGFNFAWNEGKIAGQSVPHLHFHMLPRKKGDTGITNYDPRKFLYRPGSRETSPEAELKKITRLIRQGKKISK